VDKVELEAAVLDLIDEMEGPMGDAHEIYEKLRQTIEGLRAMGMPVPDDLARFERELEEEFGMGKGTG